MQDQTSHPIDIRERPTEAGSEYDTLTQMLDFLRGTVVWKAQGIDDQQSRARTVTASELSIASVVKHLTGVERFWFSIDFADLGIEHPWTPDDPHGNFRLDDTDDIEHLINAYTRECARSRAAIDDAGLDDMARADGMDFNLRYALVHMIEETARHCGHLDLIREQLDGARGQ